MAIVIETHIETHIDHMKRLNKSNPQQITLDFEEKTSESEVKHDFRMIFALSFKSIVDGSTFLTNATLPISLYEII